MFNVSINFIYGGGKKVKKFFKHARSYIFRGLLAVIPLLLSITAIQLLYVLIDKRVMVFLDKFIEVRQIPGLGILLVLICLYLIGLIVSNVVGKQIFHFIGRITERIPVIKAIYQVGKQLSESLSANEGKQAFKKAVLIDCLPGGVWTVAFITGTIKDENTGEELLRIFVPTVPNPTTGFIFLVKASQTIDPGWSVEEAVKMIVSAGIISPSQFKRQG